MIIRGSWGCEDPFVSDNFADPREFGARFTGSQEIEKLARHVRKRWEWARSARRVAALRELDEFQAFADARQPGRFRVEARIDHIKRGIAEALLDGYGLDVAGRRVLDVGPGLGQFLDVARERGALTVGFDYDPYIVRWLQLRGHIAVHGNLLRSVAALQGQLFELVNLDGAMIADFFNLVGQGRLRSVLARLESLTAPGGTILIRPFFEVFGPQRTRRIADPQHCPFTETMLACGYRILPALADVHDSHGLPISYGRVLPRALAPSAASGVVTAAVGLP